MASQDHIRNPIEWGWDQITLADSDREVIRSLPERQRGEP